MGFSMSLLEGTMCAWLLRGRVEVLICTVSIYDWLAEIAQPPQAIPFVALDKYVFGLGWVNPTLGQGGGLPDHLTSFLVLFFPTILWFFPDKKAGGLFKGLGTGKRWGRKTEAVIVFGSLNFYFFGRYVLK